MSPIHPSLVVTEEVRAALAEGRPVVALESTIISHGMPYPQNVEMATGVEAIVRAGGAVPATIAVLHGRAHIDLGHVMARGGHGATTVASTMRLAAAAGIRVFVTGGIGGVHRGAPTSFDVSADLTELSRTPVAVVSAGVKSILDIALTLETLETLGVPVVVVGSSEFPAFYSRSSGFAAPLRSDSVDEVAAMLHHHWGLVGGGGVSIANPIPAEAEIPAAEIDGIIAAALADMDAAGVHGKDATPFLLGRIVELTGGASLAANIALVRHNAVVGTALAVAYATHTPA